MLLDTSAVLANGGTLPSGFTPAVGAIPYKTNLKTLREVLGLVSCGVSSFR
jgi:hypothetical protein